MTQEKQPEQPNPHRDLLNNASFVGTEYIEELKAAYTDKGGLLAHVFNEKSGIIPGNAFTITYISDNGGQDDDLAKGEIEKSLKDFRAIVSALAEESPPELIYLDTPAQDSIAGALDIAQLSRHTARGPGNILFLNCAPRKKQRGVNDNNKGEDVYTGILPNGTLVAAVGEESFTFFRDLIERGELELYKANVQTHGSQFRSRDFFPPYAVVLTHQIRAKANEEKWKAGLSVEERKALLSELGVVDTEKKLSLEHVSDISKTPRVVRVDTHGNLKLNIRPGDLAPELRNQQLVVTINDTSTVLGLGKSMFDKGEGYINLSRGSTGIWPDYQRAVKGDDDGTLRFEPDGEGFLQIAVINGSAAERFGISKEALRSAEGVAVEFRPEHAAIGYIPKAGATASEVGRQLT